MSGLSFCNGSFYHEFLFKPVSSVMISGTISQTTFLFAVPLKRAESDCSWSSANILALRCEVSFLAWEHQEEALALDSPDGNKRCTREIGLPLTCKYIYQENKAKCFQENILKKKMLQKNKSSQMNPSRRLSGAQTLGRSKSNQ